MSGEKKTSFTCEQVCISRRDCLKISVYSNEAKRSDPSESFSRLFKAFKAFKDQNHRCEDKVMFFAILGTIGAQSFIDVRYKTNLEISVSEISPSEFGHEFTIISNTPRIEYKI